MTILKQRKILQLLPIVLVATMGFALFSGCHSKGKEIAEEDSEFSLLRLPSVDSLPPFEGEPLAGTFTYTSEQPIVDELYRREAATPLPDHYSPELAYALYLCPSTPHESRALLSSRLRGGYIIPTEEARYWWPVVNDDPAWLLAATETALVDGSRQFTRDVTTAAGNALSLAQLIALNDTINLFEGVPSYIAASSGPLPGWMSPIDVLQTVTLANNACWMGTLRNLRELFPEKQEAQRGEQIATLRRAVNSAFWIPNMGYYSGLLYGLAYCPIQLQATENLGQALALLTGCASDPMLSKAIRQTPISPVGIAPGYPLWPRHPKETTDTLLGPRPLLLGAAWAAAAARAGNEKAFDAAVNSLLYRAANRCRGKKAMPQEIFNRPVTAVIMRGILGLQFGRDAMFFAPFVPDHLPGKKHIQGLRFRDCELEVTITGTGRAISTFNLDGKPSEPMVPASLKGKHAVAITLAGPSAHKGGVRVENLYPTFPEAPEVERTAPREVKFNNSNPRLVYLNGVETEEIIRNNYILYETQTPVAMQFGDVNQDNWLGYVSAPQVYTPPGSVTEIDATTIAAGGTPVIPDKKLAKHFVESSRWRNAYLTFNFHAQKEGHYSVQIRYIDGLGTVNSKRRTALRSLRVNGQTEGVFVMPQLPKGYLTSGNADDWQFHTGLSNSVVVNLQKGDNTLRIGFYQPPALYIDPQTNSVLLDRLRIVRL